MKIIDIYSKYNIIPNLQLHQLRVAAVAKSIASKFKENVDEKDIVSACLLHDMGNIIKFDLQYFPEFLEPLGIEYWQNVKNSFIEKYGSDEHVATIKIAKEIGVSHGVIDCIEHIGFSIIKKNEAERHFGHKICNYSDMRVGPHGVLTIDERLKDARKRYENRVHTIASDRVVYETFIFALQNMEKQIQENIDIDLNDITDEHTKVLLEELKDFEIETHV